MKLEVVILRLRTIYHKSLPVFLIKECDWRVEHHQGQNLVCMVLYCLGMAACSTLLMPLLILMHRSVAQRGPTIRVYFRQMLDLLKFSTDTTLMMFDVGQVCLLVLWERLLMNLCRIALQRPLSS